MQEIITSLENDKIKGWSKLHEKKYRDQSNQFIVEDKHLVEQAIKYNQLVTLILLDGVDLEFNGPKYYVTAAVMRKLSQQDSCAKMIGICRKLERNELTERIIILDNVQDPGNIGTIIRTAVAFGFETIILGHGCCDLYNEKLIRSTEGLIFLVNIITADLEIIIPDLIMNGYDLWTTDVNNGQDLKTIPNAKKIGIVLGNEGQGVSLSLQNKIAHKIKINHYKNCESLNVAVAAGIIMYQLGCDTNE